MEESFGSILRHLREQRGLAVNQLAIYAEVSSGLISKLENGKRKTPKPETIKKLANGLRMEHQALMKLAGYVKNDEDAEELYKELPESEVHRVIREKEAEYGVNLRDDPDLVALVEAAIQMIARNKK